MTKYDLPQLCRLVQHLKINQCNPSHTGRLKKKYHIFTQSCPTPVIPQTVAHQAPLSMEFSRKEYWSGLPFPSPGDLPDLGIEPRSPALQAPSELQGNLRCRKAFDKIQTYMIKTLSKLQIVGHLLNLIKTIYKKLTANIIFNDEKVEDF